VALTLPIAVEFCRQLRAYVRGEDRSFTPRAWMGPFGRWEQLQAAGIDWFMRRWLLARNLVMAFTLLLALSALTPWVL
jgi:1,4-dihydroxy-2-naphthoate octaprenyltransferase